MRVIIAGSRHIIDYDLVEEAVRASGFPIATVVSGAAAGVDLLGLKWALRHCVPAVTYPADWRTYGTSAGFRRNLEMAETADALVAVWDGLSRGTAHMIQVMRNRAKPVYVHRVEFWRRDAP